MSAPDGAPPGDGVRFEMLGPLRVRGPRDQLPITAPRDATVLAVLLLHAGEAVPVTHLAEAVWGAHPPQQAREAVIETLLAQTEPSWSDLAAGKTPAIPAQAGPPTGEQDQPISPAEALRSNS